ncbi:MAG: UbiA prenyltransferase [Thermomicrobiales bacterium]|nr:UbiA prenyltransferase [Thermomicrobiales bacterium]
MPEIAAASHQHTVSSWPATVTRALRPAQWLKNGVVFAGLVFGGKLHEPAAVASAALAALAFCLLSSGFYLINDIRDRDADRLHPVKRMRPVPSGELTSRAAGVLGSLLIIFAIVSSGLLSRSLLLVFLAYAGLMAAYNLGLKEIAILDVFAIASGFVLRAVAGAIVVDVSISPWLLVCTMLLALLIGFGKRRHELVVLDNARGHRRNLGVYNQAMLDQCVAVTAAGTLIAYAVYTFNGESAQYHQRMMLTIPIVAYGVFRYLYLLYVGGQGGAPEAMLLTDRPLVAAVAMWAIVSAFLFYFIA